MSKQFKIRFMFSISIVVCVVNLLSITIFSPQLNLKVSFKRLFHTFDFGSVPLVRIDWIEFRKKRYIRWNDSGTLYVKANMSSFVFLKENNNVHTRKKVRIYKYNSVWFKKRFKRRSHIYRFTETSKMKHDLIRK